MGLFSRKKRTGSLDRSATKGDFTHLEEFAKSRIGVEAFVEPRTNVTEMTVVLVANDGEWTRRRIDGADAARKLGSKLSIPVYDVAAVGYPNRMREWTRKRKERGDTGVPGLDGPTA